MEELNHIINLVKASNKPVQEVIDNYFKAVNWTMLKDEYSRFTKAQKAKFLKKLETERHI
jgi:replication-associated recombination protein RarA